MQYLILLQQSRLQTVISCFGNLDSFSYQNILENIFDQLSVNHGLIHVKVTYVY